MERQVRSYSPWQAVLSPEYSQANENHAGALMDYARCLCLHQTIGCRLESVWICVDVADGDVVFCSLAVPFSWCEIARYEGEI